MNTRRLICYTPSRLLNRLYELTGTKRQADLARLLGVSQNVISRMLTRNEISYLMVFHTQLRVPSLDVRQIIKLADIREIQFN